MTTATAILIVGFSCVATSAALQLIGWFVAFPWQERFKSREQYQRFPWKVATRDDKEKPQ